MFVIHKSIWRSCDPIKNMAVYTDKRSNWGKLLGLLSSWKCLETSIIYYVWADAPSCHLDLLDKLQKQVFRTVGPWCFSWTLDSSSNCGQLKSFYRYYFGKCSSKLTELIPLPCSCERFTLILIEWFFCYYS